MEISIINRSTVNDHLRRTKPRLIHITTCSLCSFLNRLVNLLRTVSFDKVILNTETQPVNQKAELVLCFQVCLLWKKKTILEM